MKSLPCQARPLPTPRKRLTLDDIERDHHDIYQQLRAEWNSGTPEYARSRIAMSDQEHQDDMYRRIEAKR